MMDHQVSLTTDSTTGYSILTQLSSSIGNSWFSFPSHSLLSWYRQLIFVWNQCDSAVFFLPAIAPFLPLSKFSTPSAHGSIRELATRSADTSWPSLVNQSPSKSNADFHRAMIHWFEIDVKAHDDFPILRDTPRGHRTDDVTEYSICIWGILQETHGGTSYSTLQQVTQMRSSNSKPFRSQPFPFVWPDEFRVVVIDVW